jgi:hypothetical protein
MFDEIYTPLCKGKRLVQVLKDIVLTRLVSPTSKHQTQKD